MSAPPAGGRAQARAAGQLDAETVWAALDDVKDPEIPVLSVVELGMVRNVGVAGGRVRVDITPTFAGCPAYQTIAQAVQERVTRLGAASVEVRRVLSPAWTSDAITAVGRTKLRAFGLAPPGLHGGALLPAMEAPVPCPRCGSLDTQLRSAFGSALCREIYTCRNCREPFERFKPV